MDNTAQEYINKMREAGKSDSEIKSDLLKAGWKEKDIPIQSQQQPSPRQVSSNRNKYNPSMVVGYIFVIIGIVLWFLKGTGLGAVGGGIFAFLFFLIGIIFWIVGMITEKKYPKR